MDPLVIGIRAFAASLLIILLLVKGLIGLICAKLLPSANWMFMWPEKLFCGELLLVISLFARFA
jgi:hypothetical protein